MMTIAAGEKSNVSVELLKKRSTILQKYLDHKAELELHALYALQALVHELKHPQGKFLSRIK